MSSPRGLYQDKQPRRKSVSDIQYRRKNVLNSPKTSSFSMKLRKSFRDKIIAPKPQQPATTASVAPKTTPPPPPPPPAFQVPQPQSAPSSFSMKLRQNIRDSITAPKPITFSTKLRRKLSEYKDFMTSNISRKDQINSSVKFLQQLELAKKSAATAAKTTAVDAAAGGNFARVVTRSSVSRNPYVTPVATNGGMVASNVIPVKQCVESCEDMLIVDELLREVAKRRLFTTDDEPMEM